MNKSISELLSQSLSVLVRPLVRLLLQHGITYPQFIKLLRTVYVEVAEREFSIPGKPQTDSRVSLLTGIHRRYVKELREQIGESFEIPANVSIGGQLIGVWLSDPRFVDSSEKPVRLPRLQDEKGSSFEDLVRTVTTDIRPRAVLDELLRLGVVSLDEQDHVCLERAAFIPETGAEEKLFYFGRNLHDHIAASAHNINGGRPPFMERSAYNGGLTKESVRELAVLAEQEGMRALQHVHRRANELRAQDVHSAHATYRMNFGTYYYSVEARDDDLSDADPNRR